MKKIISMVVLLLAVSANAQTGTYFPMREGAELEYRYFDGKGRRVRDDWKEERFMRITVDKIWGDTLANVTVDTEVLARKKNGAPADVVEAVRYGDVRIEGDCTMFDNVFWRFIPSMFEGGWGNNVEDDHWNVKVNSVMRMPRELHDGDKLPDLVHKSEYFEVVEKESEKGGVHELVINGGSFRDLLENQGDFATLEELDKPFGLWYSMTAVGRHVTGLVDVETPAGRWSCWRIEYDMVGPTERLSGSPTSISVIDGHVSVSFEEPNIKEILPFADYYSPEVGLVRRELLSANKRKVEQVMELVGVK